MAFAFTSIPIKVTADIAGMDDGKVLWAVRGEFDTVPTLMKHCDFVEKYRPSSPRAKEVLQDALEAMDPVAED